MSKLERFLAGEKGKKVFNLFYSWGAAVVIIGALCKITHFPYGNTILVIGMLTEALVFFIAGFDNSSNDSVPVDSVASAGSGVILGGGIVGSPSSAGAASVAAGGQKGTGISSGAGSVVVIGGGSGTGAGVSGTVQSGGGSGRGTVIVGNAGTASVPASSSGSPGAVSASASETGQVPVNRAGGTSDYGRSASDTAQNLEEFSTTIQSLNEASQKLLKAYNQITETDGFVENLTTLNQNVSGLNDVFNAQLQTITEQMSAIRYINDSLVRMKSLYDGAIGDSYMFREESAKMTKHIEALNNVYARLLQAMTTNNNPNQPKF